MATLRTTSTLFLPWLAAVLLTVLATGNAAAVDKLVDQILYPHDPSPDGVYRWSEGSIINMNDTGEMMMTLTAFGYGGHDATEANILGFRSYDYGLTWPSQEEAVMFQENIGQANIQSPSLLRLSDDELLCFFMVKDQALWDMGTWMKRSTDNGASWSDPCPSQKTHLRGRGRADERGESMGAMW